MTDVLGSLRAVDGAGIVRIECRYDAAIEDVWSAITEPARVRQWFARLSGALRVGGGFRLYVESDDVDSSGRVDVCEPRRRLVVTTRETDESWRKGQGAPPFDEVVEVTLSVDGERTVLVAEVRGLPLDPIAFYGSGWQIHAENLATYLAGRERGDTEPRWNELVPLYQELAANIK